MAKKRITKTAARAKMLTRAKKIQASSKQPGTFTSLIDWLSGKAPKRKGGKK